MTKKSEQEALDTLARATEDIINKHFKAFAGRSARYSYWSSKRVTSKSRAKDMYFYTTERIGNKFISGIYRYTASKSEWIAQKKRAHRKRMDAKARAYKLYVEEA